MSDDLDIINLEDLPYSLRDAIQERMEHMNDNVVSSYAKAHGLRKEDMVVQIEKLKIK